MPVKSFTQPIIDAAEKIKRVAEEYDAGTIDDAYCALEMQRAGVALDLAFAQWRQDPGIVKGMVTNRQARRAPLEGRRKKP